VELLKKIKNRVRGLKQKWGSATAKRELWNKEFAEGRWDKIEDTSGDVTYRFVEKYAANGSILDLGCGSGNTSCELDARSYSDYLGVDIADVALEKARARSRALQRDAKNSYVQGDIESFEPRKKFDVILFRESIYYVPNSRIKGTLEKYSRFLTGRGVIIVRLHGKEQGNGLLHLLELGRTTVEKHVPETGPVVFVLR